MNHTPAPWSLEDYSIVGGTPLRRIADIDIETDEDIANVDVILAAPGLIEAQKRVVCVCGSIRFKRAIEEVVRTETLKGLIVLSTVDCEVDRLPPVEQASAIDLLNELHLKKIDMAAQVFIVNVGGYIGESVARELAYARAKGKEIRFLEPERSVQ